MQNTFIEAPKLISTFQQRLDPRIDVYEYLKELNPERIQFLNRILSKIRFPRGTDLDLKVDLEMSNRVGGYFDLRRTIAINPLILLYGTEEEIAHILIHEGHHAGVYGDKVMEEVFTEALTVEMMKEIYNGVGIVASYQSIVDELENYSGGLSYSDLYKKISEGDEVTFDNMVELVVGKAIFDERNITQFQWESIQSLLRDRWDIISRIFPRTINSVYQTGAGLHELSTVHHSEYKLESLLKRIASRFKLPKYSMIFQEILKNMDTELNLESIKKSLIKMGYGYLIDFESEFVNTEIQLFIAIQNNS